MSRRLLRSWKVVAFVAVETTIEQTLLPNRVVAIVLDLSVLVGISDNC